MGRSLFESLTADLNIHHHSDWVAFDKRLGSAIGAGCARRIQPTHVIYERSEEWYLDSASGKIYVYLRPDDRVLPEWTKVDVFAKPKIKENDPKNINTNGLKAIPRGKMDRGLGESLKFILQLLVNQGIVEVVSKATQGSPTDETPLESIFRETATGLYYQLVEYPVSHTFLWDRTSNRSLPTRSQPPNE
jgi:hypothetical protein